MRILAALTTAVIVALTGAAQAALPAAAATASDEPVPGKLLLMLDASGSMKAKDPSGLTKIEAAKKALTGVVGALPDTAQVGLRVYGAKVDGKGKPTPAACADSQLIHPIANLDKTKLTSTIAAIKALGETPIAHSLQEALKDLGTEGKRNIVLVSDGEESCVPDPCPVIKKLTAAGVDLQIDTVGFGVNAKARQQLQCIADAGQGTYYDAKDAAALATSLGKLSQRALRPFTVTGTPVVGTASAAGAPSITAGQYTDTLMTGEGRRHYTLRRTMSGSTLRVAVTMRPPYTETANQELVRMRLTVADQPCEDGLAARIGSSAFAGLVTGTLRLSGTKSLRQAKATDCETSDTVTLSLDREDGSATPNPAEILVMEEPPVEGGDALPPADDDRPQQVAPAPVNPMPVVGGPTFSSAPRIAPGSWKETFVSGETLFYRIPVGWGQRLRVSVASAPGSVTDEVRRLTHYAPVLYAPDRGIVGEASLSYGSFGQKRHTQQVSAEVRYRNREIPGSPVVDLAGDYFIRIAIPHSRQDATAEVPMMFRVEVEGTVEGAPTYAGASSGSSTPSPSATSERTPPTTPAEDDPTSDRADTDNGSGWLVWLGLGLVAVLGALGAAYTVIRARLRGNRTK
ncbi:VWA domain-containing protein [Knoellia sp. S7-12]|uniref:vWA domain-containing protein n=1 Tax=Knoellia sp. S7-12 TaxID=3126698 RepID=UPI003365BEAA